MNRKASAVHNIAHTVSLIVIVALGSVYLQLQARIDELTRTCYFPSRDTRDNSGQIYEFVKQKGSDSLKVSSSFLTDISISKSSSLGILNEKEIYSGTKLSADGGSKSISISESSFHDNHEAIETTEKLIATNKQEQTNENILKVDDLSESKLIVDEFGKTERKSKVDQRSITCNSDDCISPSETSFSQLGNEASTVGLPTRLMETDDFQLREDLKHTDFPKQEIFTQQPQFTKDTRGEKRNSVYNEYGHADFIENRGSSTLDDHTENEKVILSEQKLLNRDILFISKTRDHLYLTQLPSELSVAEKGDFGFTNVNEREGAKAFTFSTKKFNGKNDYNDGQYCEYGMCEEVSDIDDINYMEENKEPLYFEDFNNYDFINANFIVHEEEEDEQFNRNLEKPQTYSNKANTLFKHAGAAQLKKLLLQGTVVWCKMLHGGFQSCNFQNLCYMTAEQDFVFLKSENSLKENPMSTNHEAVNEILSISLSTVPDHNAHKFSLVTLPSDSLSQLSVAVMEQRSLVISRFKPDNIMHALHDDIIPLFHTLNILNFQYNNGKSDVALLFSDHFDSGDFIDLYSALSRVPLVFLKELNQVADVVCFDDIHIGVSSSTLWYQYGFFEPQGPLPVNGSEVVINTQKASNYLAEHFFTDCPLCGNGKYLVLLSRKENRMILNEGELIMAIARSTKLKVMSVSLETHALGEVISIIRKARGLIGMHGSLLSLVIFLQPGSIVIELFPYAVNPAKYTPFKTFCDFPEAGIVYKSWSNKNKDKSEPHPDWSAAMGGIHHLSQETQMALLSQTEVPEHLCCEDPSWLYHIYQDTEVDIDAITSLTVDALAEAGNLTLKRKSEVNVNVDQSFPITPGPVRNLICNYENHNSLFILTWELPWNLNFIKYQQLDLELVYQKQGNDDSVNVELSSDVLSYSIDAQEEIKQSSYNVWVRAVADHKLNGPYVYVACKER